MSAIRRLARDRRANVVMMTGAITPVLIMLAGMGIEVNHWVVVKQELQRAADIAALAGATDYSSDSNAQTATNVAANLAELNGGVGGTRIWSASNRLLTDNQITAQVAPSVRDSTQTGVAVTVTQTVPLAFTKLLSALPTITITAEGWAEAASIQPCILALGVNGNGITTTGNPAVTLAGCSARSNASIATTGSATISAPDLYAKGSITGPGITGTLHPNDGTVPDPYANAPPIKSAFAQLKSGQGKSFSDKPSSNGTLPPGTYSSLNINGTETLQPGIYYVNGNISVGAQASLSGSGVTIVTSGGVSLGGGASITLTAATPTNSTGGAIPGIVFADNSTSSFSMSGNTGFSVAGVIYYPNGDLTFQGTAQGGAAGCLEVIAKSVTLGGNSTLAANCGTYGALSFGSDNSVVGLVR